MSIDYVNLVKLRGEVLELANVWQGEKGGIYDAVVKVGETERSDICAVVSVGEKLKNTPGFGIGAVVQISAEMTGKLGKSGRWWGSCQARKVEVLKEAPAKPTATFPLEEDELPF